MTVKTLLMASGAMLCLSACTTHDGQIYIGVDPGQIMAENGEGKICRTEKPIGSNFPKKICATEAEWEAYDAEELRASEELQKRIGEGSRAFEGGN